MLSDPWFYAAAIPAMMVIGLAKGGFTALGMMAVPILSLAISPVQAAGIVLPILILSDIVALVSYRRLYDAGLIKVMMPGMLAGVAVGWFLASAVTESEIRLTVGIISVAFALNFWFRHRVAGKPRPHDRVKGTFWAVLSGFTSFVSHAGGPPYQVYALPLRLEPRIFAGTTVILFATINAVKVVPYFFLGQFDTANLLASAVLLPVSIPATFFGVWLVKRVESTAFYRWVYVLMLGVGIYLIVESIRALAAGA